MVLTALRRAEADVLQKYAAGDVHKLLDRQPASTSNDMAQLVSARQAASEESRQLVRTALDHAQDQYLHHQCTFETHSPRPPPQVRHAVVGLLSSSPIYSVISTTRVACLWVP